MDRREDWAILCVENHMPASILLYRRNLHRSVFDLLCAHGFLCDFVYAASLTFFPTCPLADLGTKEMKEELGEGRCSTVLLPMRY